MKTIIKHFLFGKPVEGDPINLDPKYKPTLRVVEPTRRLNFNAWARKMNVSYMYGYKPASRTTYIPSLNNNNNWL
jgi:hypothetical protein